MVHQEIIDRILQNNAKGEEIVTFIEKQLPLLRTAALEKYSANLESDLKAKNAQLKTELAYWMSRVVELEKSVGLRQYSLPTSSSSAGQTTEQVAKSSEKEITVETPKETSEALKSEPGKVDKKQSAKVDKKEKSNKVAPKQEKQSADENKEVDVSRLDLRIGRIVSAKKHPEADSLYVEDIDVGEEKHRTVVSGLVKFVPLEEMQNRMVVVLCNLKPAKMRGITSEAMVMCASTPEKVEILLPPPNSVPGDRVTCKEFPGEPDALLAPKKKIFEQVAPDLKTNATCVATYKAAKLEVAGKGEVKAASLADVQIK